MGSDTTTFSRRASGGNNPNYLTTFTDPRVCRPFLVGHCPHELFENTKFEQGPCRNQHNGRLRQDYLETADREKYGYEWEYAKVLREYVEECDKRIESSQRRLETTYEEMVRQRQLVSSLKLWRTHADE
jgi:LUC7 N_terminus